MSAMDGGAVHVAGGAATLYNCTLSHNRATMRGGALFVADGTILLRLFTLLVDNVADTLHFTDQRAASGHAEYWIVNMANNASMFNPSKTSTSLSSNRVTFESITLQLSTCSPPSISRGSSGRPNADGSRQIELTAAEDRWRSALAKISTANEGPGSLGLEGDAPGRPEARLGALAR